MVENLALVIIVLRFRAAPLSFARISRGSSLTLCGSFVHGLGKRRNSSLMPSYPTVRTRLEIARRGGMVV